MVDEIKGDPFLGFLEALAGISIKLELEEKVMEHKFKVGDLVMRKTGIELWTVCDIQDDGEQIECQSTFDGRVSTFFWKGLKLAPEIPTASKFKVGDIVVQTGTCNFYTVAKLLDDECVEMIPNEHGIARRFHESALELAQQIEVDHTNWGKSRISDKATTLGGLLAPKEVDMASCGDLTVEPLIRFPYLTSNMMATDTKDYDETDWYETENVQIHGKVCKELTETYEKKNADYGNSFEKSLDKHGLIAAIVRMDDKMNRVINLNKADEQLVNDESVRDTLMDLANYAIMSVMWLDTKSGEENVDLTIGAGIMRTPEEWEKVRARFESEAEVFDAGLKAGLTQKYDIYADNLKLTGADYDGDTTNS